MTSVNYPEPSFFETAHRQQSQQSNTGMISKANNNNNNNEKIEHNQQHPTTNHKTNHKLIYLFLSAKKRKVPSVVRSGVSFLRYD
jgi:hypothetical protein